MKNTRKGFKLTPTDKDKRIAELEAQIEKMKRCEICKHYSRMCGCSYHSTSVKNCKENGMKLFELKEVKEKMKRYKVKRPKDTVEVLILPNKDGSGYQYVNLTKEHICPCKFKTELEALRDMDKKVSEGKVLYYEEIEEIKEK